MPRFRFLSWRMLRLHLALIFCIVAFGMLADWQFRRAIAGNTLSWAYAVEWPLFIAYAIVLWRRLLLDELGIETKPRSLRRFRPLARWHAARGLRSTQREIEQEVARQQYNDYLGSLGEIERDRRG